MNKNIVILGCPRSGTSLIANLVKSAGYDADGKGTKPLMKPNLKYNPDGYFERIDVVKTNDILINEIQSGCNFLNPPTFEQIVNFQKPYNEQFNELVNELKSYNGWFIKDSRLCFTLHLYDIDNLHIIKVIRKPENVKLSMINHYGNLFEEDVMQGPHTVKKIDFIEYYTHINNCIDWQRKFVPSIIVSYEDILNNNVDKIEKFIEGKIDKTIINLNYRNYAV